MRKITYYIADDGTEFDTEEECASYESIANNLPGIIGFDSNARFLDPAKTSADDIATGAFYFFITDAEKAGLSFEHMSDYYGVKVPVEFESGDFMKYDERADRWVCAEDDLASSVSGFIGVLDDLRYYSSLQDDGGHVEAVRLSIIKKIDSVIQPLLLRMSA